MTRRLALVTSRFPVGGRLEAFLHDEVAELEKYFDVTVVPIIPRMLSMRVLAAALLEFVRNPITAAKLCIEAVTSPRSLNARVKNAAILPKALAVAREIRRNGVEHIHAYWLSAPSTVAYIAAGLTGKPWSATGHRYDLVDFNITTVGTPSAGFLTKAQLIRTISERGRKQVLLAAPLADVRTVHLGVHLPAARAARHIAAPAFRLICSANLHPVKAHEVLLRALRIVKTSGTPVFCTLAGEGPERSRLEQLGAEMDIADIVEFAGSIPRPELLIRLQSGEFDAAVLTSADDGWHCSEGIPVALIEAMAAGLPCIVTNSGSVGELVNASNGVVVEPGDERGIAKAIRTLARDVLLYERLASSARATVDRSFNVTQTARAFSDLFFPVQEAAQCVSA